MNDTFSFRRFSLFFKKTLLERPLQMFGLYGLALVIAFLLYAIFKTLVGFEEAQNMAFIVGLVGCGTFLASFVFNYFGANASGSSYLTIPASSLEKWLTGVLIAGVLFPGLFVVFFHFVDYFFVSSYHAGLDPKGPFYKQLYEEVNPFPLNGFVASKTYIMFLNATGAMLVGSLYFNKAAFIKVALIVSALYIGGHLLNQFIAQAVFDKIDKALPYYCVFIPVGKEFGKVMLPDFASKAVDICMLYVMPGIFWLVSYVRLREKEF